MTNTPDRRFIRLSHSDPELAGVSMTFIAADEGAGAPDIEHHGILASVAKSDPERAARIRARLEELMAHDGRVMAWLESSPANAQLFAKEPQAALRLALPELAADFFDGWS